MEENEELKLAKEELEKLKQDKHERYLAELRMKHIMDTIAIREDGYDCGLEDGIRQGIQQGIQQGRTEGQKEIAKKMLDLKMSIKQIIEITGLTEDEIKEIR